MTTITELDAQIKELSEQRDAIIKAERQSVLEDLRASMALYGFTVDDIFPAAHKRAYKAAAVKYTGQFGQTWSGRGRPPKWFIASGMKK